MSFIRAIKVRTNPFSQLLGGKQAISFDDIAFGMNPLGLDRVQPGTFGRQKEGQNPHAFAFLLDQMIVPSDPSPHDLAHVKGGIIPDQQPAGLALRLQAGATPLQKLGSDGTHRASIDKAQRHPLTNGFIGRTLLPKHPITGEGFWVRITLLPDLFDQAYRLLLILPGMQTGKRESAPPHLVQKADGPARLRACPGDQAIARRFFL